MAGYLGTKPTSSPLTSADLGDNVITNAKMADDAVGLAELSATGTASSSNYLRGDNAWGAVSAGFTYGTEQATTSGTYKTFTGIPAGTSLIHLIFNEMSQSNANNHWRIQLGDAGGIETSGYISTCDRTGNNYSSSTSGFIIDQTYAASAFSGVMTFARVNTSHLWIANLNGKSSTVYTLNGGGSKTLSAELTQINILVNAGTMDAGSAQILYI
jgi:hypothetical protein